MFKQYLIINVNIVNTQESQPDLRLYRSKEFDSTYTMKHKPHRRNRIAIEA